MAIIAIPSLLALVSHSSGGAILSTASGGYVAGTLIPASVLTVAPAILGTVLVAGAAAGSAYLCLYGIPAPITEIFAAKGLGTIVATATNTPAFIVSTADIAAVLAALAVVGYIAYTHSDTIKNAFDSSAAKVKTISIDTIAEITDALKKVTLAASECTAVVTKDAKSKISNFADTIDQIADNMKESIVNTTTQVKETFDQVVDKVVTPEKKLVVTEALEKMATSVDICAEEIVKDAKIKIKNIQILLTKS